MKTLAHDHRHSGHSGGGFLAALLVVALLAGAVWGAWRLGVMAGDKVEWRQRLPETLSLRRGPNPQPAPLPIQRRPGVAPEMRN
ncbi:hypothetical protein [Caulobacter sp. RHG1]|uniref:hypothetical protein n=1 Tax=Caulobacter sp. (strain RHG1) TaxID=2545762 RepID=UPI001556D3AF|nr:hypothetical protein [Caulobacter sp. RHG1]NQE60347.1 hypothetical protein [Caulobacter sp. RHG1]